MLEPEERESLERGMLTLRITWVLFVAALVVYIIIANIITDDFIEEVSLDNILLWMMRITLLVISVFCLIFAYFIKRFMLKVYLRDSKRNFIQKMFASVSIILSSGAVLSSSYAVSRYMSTLISCIAFSASVGIFGLILFIIGGGFLTFYCFISAIAMFSFRPRFEEIERLAIDLKHQQDSEESPQLNANL